MFVVKFYSTMCEGSNGNYRIQLPNFHTNNNNTGGIQKCAKYFLLSTFGDEFFFSIVHICSEFKKYN